MNKKLDIRSLVAIAVFCALAYVATFLFHFRVSFLSFDLKDAVMTIGAMYYGPLAGLAMVIIVSFVEFLTISTTGVYGLLMNIIASASFVMIGTLIYSKRRTMTGAVIGMVSSVVGMTAVMMVANLVITPYYMGAPVEQVVSMIPTLLLPFNFIKAIFNAAIVFVLYKPVFTVLKASGIIKKSAEGESKVSAKSMLTVCIIAAVVAAVSLCIFFVVLHGTVSAG